MFRSLFLKSFVLIVLMVHTSGTVWAGQPPLKAVLVVGHQEDGTAEAIKLMEQIRLTLQQNGVQVSTFYDQKAVWGNIRTAATGAHFFVYSGHGSTMGPNGSSGGLCITERISPDSLLADLKLAPQALILFSSVCRGAGSSAGDDGDIGIAEAQQRVEDYSAPFFQMGAAAYYACNLSGGVKTFLTHFFQGKNLQQCYDLSLNGWATTELNEAYGPDQKKQICIASSKWKGMATLTTYTNGKKKVEKVPAGKSYNTAYVGDPTYSLASMTSK